MSSQNSTGNIEPSAVWIYHERQEARLCGQHALNNLAQGNVFSTNELAEIALHLDTLELNVFAQNNEGGRNSNDYRKRLHQGSQHVDEAGNFSIEVLKAALQEKYGIALPHLSSQQRREAGDDICTLQGFLCHKSDHWFVIRLIGGRYWDLNSLLERPVAISHFTLGTEMDKWQNVGYSVFCIASGLPQGGTKQPFGPGISSTHAQWHRMSDVLQGKSTDADPWEKLSGRGMRLDGKRLMSDIPSSMDESLVLSGLTEEEMFQIAVQDSLQQHTGGKPIRTVSDLDPISPEPSADTPGAIRIQFKMPNGSRTVRRFHESDPVANLYLFVQQYESVTHQDVELRYGFPPKSLSGLRDATMKEASLANETIQGRFI